MNNVVSLPSAHRDIATRLKAAPRTPTQLVMDLVAMDLPFPVTLEIGKVLGIKKSPISRARGLYGKGSKELIAQVYRGEISLWEATCQLYPATAAAHDRSRKRARETDRLARNAPVELPVQLPTASAVAREVRTAVIHACDIILGLPQARDVTAILSPPEREKLARAGQRLGEIVNVDI